MIENVDYSRAYDFIRGSILNGTFRSGQPLTVDVIATEVGLSRTPVRDALRQLAADGLVTNRPRVGASVRSFSVTEYSEMSGLRMALEIFAAGLAARLRTDSDLKEMTSAHESLKAEVQRLIADGSREPDPILGFQSEHLVREDIRFHMAITNAARNDLIKKEIIRNQLINRIITMSHCVETIRPVPHSRTQFTALARSTVREHDAILDAIQRRDAAAARDAMERNLQVDVDSVLERMAGVESQRLGAELAGTGDPNRR